MNPLRIRAFAAEDTEVVVALWYASGLTRSWNDPYLDIARKATTQPELFLVGTLDDAIVATAMVGYDGHRGWINYLAVAETLRGHGHARALMDEAGRLLILRGCPKLNLQVRGGNLAARGFYAAIGYVEDDTIGFGKRLIVDPPAARMRDDPGPPPPPQEPTMAHALSWFEIPVDDFDRAKMFYGRILDCEMPEMAMGPSRMAFFPYDPAAGEVGGAIVQVADFLPSRQGSLVYLNGGEDLSVILLRVEEAGGKVVLEKTQITPEFGWYATFLDTEGNKVALHSPK